MTPLGRGGAGVTEARGGGRPQPGEGMWLAGAERGTDTAECIAQPVEV